MPPELAILVPTRGRPGNIAKVLEAWDFTGAWDHAQMIVAFDADDPQVDRYVEVCRSRAGRGVNWTQYPTWLPMVHKLDETARALAGDFFALGFAGDDHLPRTIGWAGRYLAALKELGTGLVYGDDGYQGAKLCTEWAMTSDIVRAIGRMVPAPVEHMYSDVSLLELVQGASCARHLPEIRIEHMHPIVKKAENDDQYRRVNSREQFKRDRETYRAWQRRNRAGQIEAVKALAPARPAEVKTAPTPKRKATKIMPHSIVPRNFRRVRGATSDEISLTLADFAFRTPSDQAIVELGVFQGRTALLMAYGARRGAGAHVWAIDPWELAENTYGPPFKTTGSRNWARYNVKAMGYSNQVTLIQGFSTVEAARWSGPPVGLLFVDADHSYEGARADLLTWSAHLAPGAIIAVDDYGHPDWPGVKEAVDALVAEGILDPVEVFHDQLAVTRMADGSAPSTSDQEFALGPMPEDALTTGELDPDRPCPPVGSFYDQDAGLTETEQEADRQAEAARAALAGAGPAGEAHAAGIPPAEGRPVESVGPAQTVPMAGLPPARDLGVARPGEIQGLEVETSLENLNIAQLKALAKARKIKLGVRKDKRELILAALRAGK